MSRGASSPVALSIFFSLECLMQTTADWWGVKRELKRKRVPHPNNVKESKLDVNSSTNSVVESYERDRKSQALASPSPTEIMKCCEQFYLFN